MAGSTLNIGYTGKPLRPVNVVVLKQQAVLKAHCVTKYSSGLGILAGLGHNLQLILL